MTTISELDNLTNDIEVAPPDQYVDGSLPDLLPEGTYDLLITDWEASTRDDGNGNKIPDGKSFILKVEVMGGEHDGHVVRNLRVWTTTYERKGVRVSGLGDLIRSLDPTATFSGVGGAATILQKAKDTRMPFRAKLQWEAFDNDWYVANGGTKDKTPENKVLRRTATVKGMKNFRQAADGSYLPEAEGPSGAILEARLVVDRYFPKRG